MDIITSKAKLIKLLILDVDGVLTDGMLYFGPDSNSEETKGYNVKDGLGITLLQKSDIHVAVITGRKSKSVSDRLAGLKIEYIFQGQENKFDAYLQLINTLNVSPEQVAYVGDDIIDLPVMSKIGLSIAVNDAHPEILKRADWVTKNRGGNGAVREVCDLILQAQDKFDSLINQYLER